MFNLDAVACGCSVKEGILKNFINLTGKQLYQRSQACNFIKKDILLQVFSCEFGEIFINAISIEHVRWLLLLIMLCSLKLLTFLFLVIPYVIMKLTELNPVFKGVSVKYGLNRYQIRATI